MKPIWAINILSEKYAHIESKERTTAMSQVIFDLIKDSMQWHENECKQKGLDISEVNVSILQDIHNWLNKT